MNRIISLLLLPLLAVSFPAVACKMLVRYPAHLEHLNAQERGHFYVVAIKGESQGRYIAKVERAFGGLLRPGETTEVRFLRGEESHAICPIELKSGRTYLLRSTSEGREIEVSRYNWLNVPSTHERFGGYVQDLIAGR